MSSEQYLCPTHGPYDASYEGCPYCRADIDPTSRIIRDPIDQSAKALLSKANVTIPFDMAPDGVQRYIKITRNIQDVPISILISQFTGIDVEILDKHQEIIKPLEKLMSSYILSRGLYNPEVDELKEQVYLSSQPLSFFMPDTLITQILTARRGSVSVYYPFEDYHSATRSDVDLSTDMAPMYGEEEFQRLRKKIEEPNHIALSTIDGSIYVVRVSIREGNRVISSFVRELKPETIALYEPHYIIYSAKGNKSIEEGEILENDDQYLKALYEVAKDNSLMLLYRININGVAIALFSLYQSIRLLNEDGKIHGDLKPQNILSLADNLEPIGSMDVMIGGFSPGRTLGFCAPEQVLHEPVSPTTDIYNFGRIMLLLVNGVLHGEISEFLVPTGGTKYRNVKIITSPDVYLDYETTFVNKNGISDWRKFLCKCLAFHQEDRFQTIPEMLNTYEELLNAFPLEGYVELEPRFGRLRLFLTDDGFYKPAWELYDSYDESDVPTTL